MTWALMTAQSSSPITPTMLPRGRQLKLNESPETTRLACCPTELDTAKLQSCLCLKWNAYHLPSDHRWTNKGILKAR